MNQRPKTILVAAASSAARAAGQLMRDNFRTQKKVDAETQHDIKLELDRRCQALIESRLRRHYPAFSILGEEGVSGDASSEFRWVIDPIDGTVNFTYGIPHCCVSIAVQQRIANGNEPDAFRTIAGVVYDPFCDELWTAVRGAKPFLNGRAIAVSKRLRLDQAIVAMGFAKQPSTLQRMLPFFNALIPRVRKVRMMGAAALSLVYVASGRHDAYVEYGLRLWDIAAGGLILECAGGELWNRHLGDNAFHIIANNGLLRRQLQAIR